MRTADGLERLSTMKSAQGVGADRMRNADPSPIEKARKQYVDIILKVGFKTAYELWQRQKEVLIDADCDAEIWED